MTAEHFQPTPDQPYPLPRMDAWPESVHVYDEASVWAVRTALAANRPLLISGEPGIGKSQLARAVAAYFHVPFLPFVVHARSECSDLLYQSDPVSRLAQAQVLGHASDKSNWRELLAEDRFVRPGALWWAFDWASAAQQARRWCRVCGADPAVVQKGQCCEACCEPLRPNQPPWQPGDGCVVLIDEIDKADSEFPNGLLESLGNIGFFVAPTRKPVTLVGRPPLLAITTNRERELPAAFIRRCLVLSMSFPPDRERQTEEDFLVARGKTHFGEDLSDDVYTAVAGLVLKERKRQKDELHRPGAAEYLDILRALFELYKPPREARQKQLDALEQVAKFSLRKQTGSLLT
jgi:MoxR-like ATPase